MKEKPVMKRVLESMLAGGVLGAIVFTFIVYIGFNVVRLPWGNFDSFLSGAIVMAISGCVFGAVVGGVTGAFKDYKPAGWITGAVVMVFDKLAVVKITGKGKISLMVIVWSAVVGFAIAALMLSFVKTEKEESS